jgi:hypothetical protein
MWPGQGQASVEISLGWGALHFTHWIKSILVRNLGTSVFKVKGNFLLK